MTGSKAGFEGIGRPYKSSRPPIESLYEALTLPLLYCGEMSIEVLEEEGLSSGSLKESYLLRPWGSLGR